MHTERETDRQTQHTETWAVTQKEREDRQRDRQTGLMGDFDPQDSQKSSMLRYHTSVGFYGMERYFQTPQIELNLNLTSIWPTLDFEEYSIFLSWL